MRRTTAWVLAALALVSGCGKGDDKAKQSGEKVGQAVTDFAAGVGRGADKSLLVNLTLTPEMEAQGLSKSTAKSTGLTEGKKAITVYFVAKTPFKGTLIVKAFNKEGLEIGRALTDVDFGADDAKYTEFAFDDKMDSQLVDKYVVDIKK